MQAFRRRSDVRFGFQKPSVGNVPTFSKDGVMVCLIQQNIVPFKIIVQINLGVNKQHNFTSLLKNLNALVDLGNHRNVHGSVHFTANAAKLLAVQKPE